MADLPTRELGKSGLQTSIVGLGCNNFGRRVDLEGTRAVVDAALDEGVNFLDTADIYGRGMSEEYLGEVLTGRRDQVILATKFGMDMGDGKGPRGSREYVRQALDASLKRLQTDTVDYYWYHQPDEVTPIAETLEALHELIQAGKVRKIGASNFTAQQIRDADEEAGIHGYTPFTAIQNQYSLLVRDAEAEVLPTCAELQLGFVPFFPLASGLLTGKYRRGEPAPEGTRLAGREQIATDAQFELIAALERYAYEHGVALTDVAIGALLADPTVSSVIAGATTPDQVRSNAAAGRWAPGDDDIATLRQILSDVAV
jgi:aryl-alcohol dehydrogenase-like predicted oxidoreductase